MDNAKNLLQAKKQLGKGINKHNNFNFFTPAILKTSTSNKLTYKPDQNKKNKIINNLIKELNNKNKLINNILKPTTIITSAILLSVGVLAQIKKKTEGDIYKGGITANVYGNLNFNIGKSDRSSGKVSDNGLNIIKNHEGLRLTAYKPVAAEKYYTIGYGHYGPDVQPGQTITKEQAEDLLRKDVAGAEATVNKYVKVDLTQNQFDALVSFCYNVGSGNFKGSTLLKKLNKGDYEGAAQEFNKWNKGSGKVLGGLVKRRAAESALFSSDIGKEIETINKQKPNPKSIQRGGKVAGYQLKDDVELSAQATQYLKETGGTGVITSGLDGKHAGTASNPRSHYSGNKIDVRIGGMTNEQVIKIMLPFLKHPATLEVAVEGFGKTRKESDARMVAIRDKILSSNPDIAKRVKNGTLKIVGDRRKDYKPAPHLDVLINPKNLKYENDYVIANKNEEKAKVAFNNTKPTVPTKSVQSEPNINKILVVNNQPNQETILTGDLGKVNLKNVYKNSNT